MINYKHGVYVEKEYNPTETLVKAVQSAQVVIGTAPIFMVDDPDSVVNAPVLCEDFEDAKKKLGYSDDWESYTLCQSMWASFKLCKVSPVVFINVLDLSKHKKPTTTLTAPVINGVATVDSAEGVIKNTVTVKANGGAAQDLVEGEDYVISYDSDGHLLITLVAGTPAASATSLTVKFAAADPAGVTYLDVIGGEDPVTGKESGLDVISNVYPETGYVPGIVSAPGWTQIKDVSSVIQAKLSDVSGRFSAFAMLDLCCDSGADLYALSYHDCGDIKEEMGLVSDKAAVYWPEVQVGDRQMYMSAIASARAALYDATQGGVPAQSPSNVSLPITGLCLHDGTRVYMDETKGNELNACGICTAINFEGWRLWGDNTAAYPEETSPEYRFINVVRMFIWQANRFIISYFKYVDQAMTPRLLNEIVDSENSVCAAMASRGYFAGASISAPATLNTRASIMAGELHLLQSFSPYTPVESITCHLFYDIEPVMKSLGFSDAV